MLYSQKLLAAAVFVVLEITFTSAAPSFTLYQERFSNYSAVAERSMQTKRAQNSNETNRFNQVLLPILADGSIALRRTSGAARLELEEVKLENQTCLQLGHELFHIYDTFAVENLQDCAQQASEGLVPLTTDNFFRYANFVNRELTRITSHALEALGTYNKVSEMDKVDSTLEQYYQDFVWMYDKYQVVLEEELERFKDNHPIEEALKDCVHQMVHWYEADLANVIEYLQHNCEFDYENVSKQ